MLLYLETISDTTKIITFSNQLDELNRKEWKTNRNQTDELLVEIDKIIKSNKKQIDGVFVNTNFGPYTSVRIGLTVVNFLALALNIQPVGVGSVSEICFRDRQEFREMLVPMYQNSPVITKKKNRL